MNVWRWVARNSKALQGVAALVILLSSIVAVPTVIWRWLKPDLVLRVDPDTSTIPPDLVEWIGDLSEVLEETIKDLPNREGGSRDKLVKLASFMTTERLSQLYGSSMLGRLLVEVRNQTDHTVSGVRVSLNDVYGLWRATVRGTFLTDQEAEVFLAKIKPFEKSDRMVLPELPPLPARSVFQIVFYGKVEHAEPEISAQGATAKIERVVEVEDGWIVDWYRYPYKALPFFLFLFLLVLMVSYLVSLRWERIKRKIIRNAVPDVVYNLACKEAAAGRSDQAMVLLQKAFEEGFRDRAHAVNDIDLASLRDRVDFKKLVME